MSHEQYLTIIIILWVAGWGFLFLVHPTDIPESDPDGNPLVKVDLDTNCGTRGTQWHPVPKFNRLVYSVFPILLRHVVP